MAEEAENASGDLISEEKPEPEPEPEPIPDVELIIDGFGFMPKPSSLSLLRKGRKSSKDIDFGGEEENPCGSSSNIDIVRRYTWKTKNRMQVQVANGKMRLLTEGMQVISYGATITSLKVPDKKGVPDDVIAGFEKLEEYFQPRNPYFGATIGRYANVITEGTFVVKPSGRTYMVSTNKGSHHYHGGNIGFDKVNWRSYVNGNKVIMSHVSERFSEGFPGTLMAQITFEVTCNNTIRIDMRCTTSEPTIVNLSNCLYFNLGGHQSGSYTLMDHIVTINADKYIATDEDGLITGEKKVVGGTALDFRVPRMMKVMLPKIPLGGYDHNYCITQGIDQDLTFQGRALHPGTGRVLEVYSNQPGMQFYTGNDLPDPDKILEEAGPKEEQESVTNSEKSSLSGEGEEEESKGESEGRKSVGYVPLVGKNGAIYIKHGLFTMMPQNYPDAINHKNFPNAILNPGEVYVHRIEYKFGILLGKYV